MRFILFIPVLLLLQACSQTTPIPAPSLSSGNKAIAAAPPEQWTIKAKLGIRTADDNGSLTLHWQQQDANYKIQLQGSLGQGNATIYGDHHYIVIEQPGKMPLYSNDATSLIKDTFGWALPINDFIFWIRGIANPEQPVESLQYNAAGTLASLQQSQWTLNYSRYKTVDQWQLPGRIRAQQDDAQLTLIIREWLLP
jgi:outer membrane lipoprotein LolB